MTAARPRIPATMSGRICRFRRAGEHPVVAVDAGGRLWYGDSHGLYRYDGSSWLSIYTDRGICDLTPAADGTLYAQVPGYGSSDCQPFRGEVLAMRSDGTRDGPRPIEWLVAEEPGSVRSAYRRNTLWAVAPDGAIWTLDESGLELHRRDDEGLRKFALPVDLGAVQRLEVDVHNHVWLVANSQIWRMSGPLDFALQMEPSTWLLAPGRVRQGQVRILSSEGYSGTVSLSVIKAPADITVHLGADSIAAGQSVTLTLEAASNSLPAVDRLVVSGTDGSLDPYGCVDRHDRFGVAREIPAGGVQIVRSGSRCPQCAGSRTRYRTIRWQGVHHGNLPSAFPASAHAGWVGFAVLRRPTSCARAVS